MRLAAALVLVLLSARPAWAAGVSVSISHDSEEHLELARRLASELSSEGYAVEIHAGTEPSPCEPSGTKLAPFAPVAQAWIRLKASATGSATVVASICYLGALPFLQQAAPSGPLADPRQLALATAEALNGLRSKLPVAAETASVSARNDERSVQHEGRSGQSEITERPENQLVFGAAFVRNFPDFPLIPGLQGRATLGLSSFAGLSIDAFVPTSGRDLSNEQVTATVRSAWLRIGPRFNWTLGDFAFSTAALAGPAVTWATAVARAPRVGTADVAAGAVLSLAASIEYPSHGPVFACGSVAASALLPGVRVRLGESAHIPRGSWPLEGSIGLGARWGL